MYQLIGAKENIKNFYKLARPYLDNPPASKFDLMNGFRKFLREFQPKVPQPDNLEMSLLWKKNEIGDLLSLFNEDSILDDFVDVFAGDECTDQSASIIQIKNALSLMRSIDSQFSDVVETVIHTIFSAPSRYAGGGSTSAAVGCIWADLRTHWDNQDVIEFLVHETTHNLVFVDELCYKHYFNYQEIAKEVNFPISAIRNKPRPLDKVFHSIIVAVEVLKFREIYLGNPEKPHLHPPSDIIMQQTQRSIDSIKNNSNISELMTERSTFLLENCEKELKTIELTSLERV